MEHAAAQRRRASLRMLCLFIVVISSRSVRYRTETSARLRGKLQRQTADDADERNLATGRNEGSDEPIQTELRDSLCFSSLPSVKRSVFRRAKRGNTSPSR